MESQLGERRGREGREEEGRDTEGMQIKHNSPTPYQSWFFACSKVTRASYSPKATGHRSEFPTVTGVP
jgi:hypothetical protein